MKNAYKATRDIADHDKHYFSDLPPESWVQYGVSPDALKQFAPPSKDELLRAGTQIHFFSYYKYWDPQENYYYCREHTNFSPNPERTSGTYSKYASLDDCFDGFHYYLGFIKFGIGRATSDTAHEIRDGKITREEGVALVQKYDDEFPSKYLDEFLEYCGIDFQTLEDIVDSWRSPHIWRKRGNSWELKSCVWDD